MGVCSLGSSERQCPGLWLDGGAVECYKGGHGGMATKQARSRYKAGFDYFVGDGSQQVADWRGAAGGARAHTVFSSVEWWSGGRKSQECRWRVRVVW